MKFDHTKDTVSEATGVSPEKVLNRLPRLVKTFGATPTSTSRRVEAIVNKFKPVELALLVDIFLSSVMKGDIPEAVPVNADEMSPELRDLLDSRTVDGVFQGTLSELFDDMDEGLKDELNALLGKTEEEPEYKKTFLGEGGKA